MPTNKILKSIFGTDKVWEIIPGTVTAIAVMIASILASHYLGILFKATFDLRQSPVSTFLLAILFGIILRNVIRFPPIFEPGFKFCVAKVLRLGIMLLGIGLSLLAVVKIGAVALIVVLVCIVSAIILTTLLARVFGVSKRLGTLIAAGTAICGVSAIVATSPAIGAREEETAYAISTITIFGLLATIIYPYLLEIGFGLDLGQAGLFLGTAVHDTSQVTGAAYIYDQVWNREVSKIAITTKLVRNTLMMAVIPTLSLMYSRGKTENQPGEKAINPAKFFPLFVLGFLGFAAFRSIGDFFISRESARFLLWSTPGAWSSFYGGVKQTASYLLTLAISGAGLSTLLSKLKSLTLKPFLIGLMSALCVGLISLLMVVVLSVPIASLLLD